MNKIEVITLTKSDLEALLEESAERAVRKFSNQQAQWMQRPAAAAYLGIDSATLDKYTIRDGIPYHPPRKSKLKLYNKVDLDAWGRGNTWN